MKAKIWNFKAWVEETDPKKLYAYLENLLQLSEFKIVGFVDKHFKPQGYSGTWLISESHLAVHTFPERSKTYIELSSCNAEKQKKLVELFNLKKVQPDD